MFLTPVLTVLALATLTAAAAPVEHAYVGSDACKKCHIKEWKSWSETKMAQAYELLKPGVSADKKKAAGLDPDKDYTTDQECLSCHVTGLGEEGGFVDAATTPKLVGVGCEMCHGPGGTYIKDGYMTLKNKEYKKAELVKVGLVGEVSAARCTVCHNDKSPFVEKGAVFDFAARRKEGTHEQFPLKYAH